MNMLRRYYVALLLMVMLPTFYSYVLWRGKK